MHIHVGAVQDTAGIHNLHGMPGILGGLAAGVGSLYTKPSLGSYPHAHHQWAWQLVAIAAVLVVAIVTGALAGFVVQQVDPMRQSLGEHGFFEDALFWEEVESEEEIGHGDHGAPAGETVSLARG